MNIKIVFLLIFFFICAHLSVGKAMSTKLKQSGNVVGTSQQNNPTPLPNDERTKKIIEQERLLEEGRHLTEQGYYDEAIMKYQEAMSPELLLHDYDIEPPIFLMSKAQKFQGKYEEALRNINEVLKKHPNVQEGNWHEQRLELEALIKARDTKSDEPVYEYIDYLKEKYKKQLPPQGYLAGLSDIIITTIIRLYDHIGAYDKGINFVDEIVDQSYSKNKSLERAQTAKEALQKSSLGGKNQGRYKNLAEYLRIREAFEQDKAEGFKGCRDAKPQPQGGADKPASICMGRATKALIKSDYFPW